MADEVVVTGVDELAKRFDKLNAKASAKELSKVLSKAATPIAKTARKLAPFDPSPDEVPHIKRSIRKSARRGSGRSNTLAQVEVGVSRRVPEWRKVLPKAVFQEYGTKRQRPNEFLRPALEQHRDNVIRSVERYVEEITRDA
jgi:HK97 gp10 family phage protein